MIPESLWAALVQPGRSWLLEVLGHFIGKLKDWMEASKKASKFLQPCSLLETHVLPHRAVAVQDPTKTSLMVALGPMAEIHSDSSDSDSGE